MAERKATDGERGAGRTTRRRIAREERLATVRQLAGGLAHDLNNLLAGIMGYADLIDLVSQDEVAKKYAAKINVSVERAARLLRQLLLFARQGPFNPHHRDAGELLRAAVARCRRDLPAEIELREEVTAEVSIPVDEEQLPVALDHLLANAIDALAEGGCITVSLVRSVDPGLLRRAGLSAEGDWVALRVADDGPGVPTALAGRIFEPFFTTKDVGHGYGMGLAAVHGVASRHGGAIVLTGGADGGAVFSLLLPVTPAETPAPSPAPAEPARPATGRILLVEDEATIGETISLLLRNSGYEVTTVTDGPAAVELYRQEHAAIDAVLLDVKLPGMDGAAVLAAMREIYPGVACLVLTGHALDETAHRMLAEGARDVLYKPVRRDRLAAAVTALLDSAEDPPEPVNPK